MLVNCVGGSWGITAQDLTAPPPRGFRGLTNCSLDDWRTILGANLDPAQETHDTTPGFTLVAAAELLNPLFPFFAAPALFAVDSGNLDQNPPRRLPAFKVTVPVGPEPIVVYVYSQNENGRPPRPLSPEPSGCPCAATATTASSSVTASARGTRRLRLTAGVSHHAGPGAFRGRR